MTEDQERDLLANVRSLTDRMAMVDEVFRQLKLGRNMVLAFMCGHSGLYFQGDFLREWGRTYGIGLGPDPVSEVLNTDYDSPLPRLDENIRRIEQIAFGVGNTRAQVDALLVDADQVTKAGLWAVKAIDDPDMQSRMQIIRPKQLKNPRGSALASLQTSWLRQKGALA